MVRSVERHGDDLIRTEGLAYAYDAESDAPIDALSGIDLRIRRGEYLAVVGQNGSGKSTLARCLNGLLRPTLGDVWVDGMNTRDLQARYAIRATVGMVFQNPDNQFVSAIAKEEVAFGPENLGVPHDELRERVRLALEQTGLWTARDRNPRLLSAGEKTRLAIASVLAMRPTCLVLDESTAMLDPVSRRDLLALLRDLHREGLTLVTITHYMDETVDADRILALEQGRIALLGTPPEVYAHPNELAAMGLSLPAAAAIARGIAQRGIKWDDEILDSNPIQPIVSAEQLVAAVTARLGMEERR